MEIGLIVSIVLNIVAVLVYFKVPEFIQSYFLKRIEHNYSEELQEMEHKFQLRFDTLRKRYEVLPELYNKIVMAESYYKQHFSGESLNNRDLKYLADMKNYITRNRFFIDENIFKKARECEELIMDWITNKKNVYHSAPEEIERFKKGQDKIEAYLENSIIDLEKMIYETINS